MVCPNCKRDLIGSPRRCGYCGESLVKNYFQQTWKEPKENKPKRQTGPALAVSLVLGVFGVISLLFAFGFGLSVPFGRDVTPGVGIWWWCVTVVTALLALAYFIQICVLRGFRFSLWFDGVWLFLSACALFFTAQLYLDQGEAAFFGMNGIAYFLALGFLFICAASITSILSYQR
jgi:hypothetical protein